MPDLSKYTLPAFADRMEVPRYSRTHASNRIVHFGVGAFHRSHQAMYLDRVLSTIPDADWAITGVGVLPVDAAMADALHSQDCLYTLVVREPDGRITPRIIGSIIDYLFAPDDAEAVIEAMAEEATRIVSLTITEGGYHIDPVTGAFDSSGADLRADLSREASPTTAFGLITEALHRRRSRDLAPFTVLSCDNIEGNGDVAHRSITGFAGLRDPELAAWIDTQVAFPNSMVDRITPITTDADRHRLSEEFDLQDRWPVVCEPYTQWVLEDVFSAGRPPLQQVGVQLVSDVRPYELMKLRLLNGGHQALGFLGALSGHTYVHEAATDDVIEAFVRAYMRCEAAPTLDQPDGVDLAAYQNTLMERFANPAVADTLTRLCAYASDRIPKFVLPVVREQLAHSREVARAALIVAAWARYCEASAEIGSLIKVQDAHADRLIAAAVAQRQNPLAFLGLRQIFGDLADDARFVQPYLRAVEGLRRIGRLEVAEAMTTTQP